MAVAFEVLAGSTFPLILADAVPVGITVGVLDTGLAVAGIWAVASAADWVAVSNEDTAIIAGPVLVAHTVPGIISAGVLTAEIAVGRRGTEASGRVIAASVAGSGVVLTGIAHPVAVA